MMQEQRKFDVEAALSKGATQEQVEAFMLQNNLVPLNLVPPPEVPARTPEESLSGASSIGPAPPGAEFKYNLSKIQPYLSSIIGLGAGVGTAATGVGILGSAAASSGATALSDTILDKYINGRQNYPISESLGITTPEEPPFEGAYPNFAASFIENFALQEALGRVIPVGKATNLVRNVIKESAPSPQVKTRNWILPNALSGRNLINRAQTRVASTRDKILNKFGKSTATVGKGSASGRLTDMNPTFSQMRKFNSETREFDSSGKPYTGGIKGKLGEWIENLFAGRYKNEAVLKSTKIGMDKTEGFSSQLMGTKTPISLIGEANKSTLDEVANRLRKKTQDNFDFLQLEMTDINDQLEIIKQVENSLSTIPKTDPTYTAIQAQIKANLPEKTRLTGLMKEAQMALTDFWPRGAKGWVTGDYLVDPFTGKNVHAPTPITDVLFRDEVRAGEFFRTGEIKIGGKKISSSSPRKDTAGYAFMRIISDAYDSGTDTLDVNRMMKDWNDYRITNAGKKVLNPTIRAAGTQLLKKLQAIGGTNKEIGASRYLTLRLASSAAMLTGGLVSAMISSGPVRGLQTAGSIVGGSIGLHQLGKLMTNTDTARLLVAAMEGGPLGMSPALASRIIGRALRGETIEMEFQDSAGNKSMIPGKINGEGRFVSQIAESTKDTPKFTVKY